MRPFGQGILPDSKLYFFNPSNEDKQLFFYPLCTGIYQCDSSYYVSRNNYNSYLILYVISGSVFLMDGEIKHTFQHGEFFLINCYKPHCYGSDTGCRILFLHYDGSDGQAFFNRITRNTAYPQPVDAGTACRYLNEIYKMFDGRMSLADNARINKMIVGILTEFMAVDQNTAQSSTTAMDLVRLYIDDNLREPLSLAELAERANLSVYYFTRQFKKLYGYSPHEYVMISRLNSACFYLMTTDMSVNQISERCGFTDQCNFCTCFKKRMGVTPKQYRSSNQNESGVF